MPGKPLVLILVLAALGLPAHSAQKGSGPRPALWKDEDTVSIPEPASYDDSVYTLYWDFFNSTFGQAPRTFFSKLENPQPAWNVNAWDEAPDSSWYTNRNHLRLMTLEEIRRGPNQGPGPELPLVVLRGKEVGTSPGFGRSRDARGNVYFVKFDGVEYPELSTAAEVIGARLFYAMGFHVPEEWIIHLRADQIRLDPEARIWDEKGRRRKMAQADVDEVLKRVARLPDGRYRAVASLHIPGTVKGKFQFYGTRKDDPNDLIPHQHRRELRGLRLLCAWLNHYDMRVGNTLDTYIAEQGRNFLRHYLQDFGSTLGSASYFPKAPRMGSSYILDLETVAGSFFTLGFHQPRWREQPAPVHHPSVGRFESTTFSPSGWKPVFPVASFSYMDGADAFWAAKIVMSFTEEQLRAVVREGQFSDAKAEEFLVRTLVERQRKIGRYGFSQVNPLDQFKISETDRGQELEFQDLAVNYRFSDPSTTWYFYTFSRHDDWRPLGRIRSFRGRRIPLGELLKLAQEANLPGSLFALSLGTHRAEPDFKNKWVRVYLERDRSGFRLRGWEREN